MDYIINNINHDDKLLIVDDVFDSGRSIQAIFAQLKKATRANMPKDIRTACPWYKPNKNVTELKPDFYLHETDQWLVFPHELKGLTLEEVIKSKPSIAETITKHKL